MKKYGATFKYQISPGLWVCTEGTVHMETDLFLASRGLPVTDENREKLIAQITNLHRKFKPDGMIVQTFDADPI